MKKILTIALIVVLGSAGAIGAKYYAYVTANDSPYDEIGIALTGFMPAPLRDWGCSTMHARFGNVLPPYGCQSDTDARTWR